ncbi:hypothetical protein DFA_06126 [Cavenderia fasciculata]|uniref:Uncharacterized protein n=1 Tax=Cavenderia fasciculata TaxID=261658 RepID=F4PK64_CACFS|nr:uncharacterized protein DFA_06126 [Cavenderia fasciculata]EGG23988.1 hypothetical protein DFA_06126 [Cavenderia fasciculata]|eukprot:XP_004361839.1 hypothetical protein DFA_06126 [Cavenderia fasciculata]
MGKSSKSACGHLMDVIANKLSTTHFSNHFCCIYHIIS